MADPVADDGVTWNSFDKLMAWLLPPFLAYVGVSTGNGGWRYVAGLAGVLAGISVVRGLEAAINARRPG